MCARGHSGRAQRVRVRGRAPTRLSLARPLLPAALHAAMAAESLTRASSSRRDHKCARAHPAAAPKGPVPRPSGSQERGHHRANLSPLPAGPHLRSPSAPRVSLSGVPASPPRPPPGRPTPGARTQRLPLPLRCPRLLPQPAALTLLLCPSLSLPLLCLFPFLPPALHPRSWSTLPAIYLAPALSRASGSPLCL